MSTSKNSVVSLTLLMILLSVFSFAIPVKGAVTTDNFVPYSGGANTSINTTDVEIYGLDSNWDEYISIPNNFKQSFQLVVKNAKSVSYRVTKGNSVTVSESGMIEPVYEVWYWKGNVGSTSPSWAENATRIEKNANYGSSEITVIADDKRYVVSVELVDYAEYYANKIMDEYIANNIDSSMTDYEKLDAVCRFVASYDYSAYHSSSTGMIVSGEGGDCWASTNTIVTMCQKLGYNAWGRNGNKDAGGGSGHRNAIVQIGNIYYILEAGYNETAPRYYSIDTKTSLFSYRHNNEGISVYQYDAKDNLSGTFVIPKTIDGYTVTEIDDKFSVGSGISEVTKIEIPDTVTYIGEDAFYDCNKITSIDLPSSLVKLGTYAFASCVSLKEITIPESVTALGDDPFFNCTSLMNIYVSDCNLNYMDTDGVLYDKEGDTLISYPRGREGNISIPATVKELELGVFAYCTQIKNADIPKNISKLPQYAFYNCTALEAIVIDSSVKTIETGAFYACDSLKNVYYRGSKEQWNAITIGGYNTSLTDATIQYNYSGNYLLELDRLKVSKRTHNTVTLKWNKNNNAYGYEVWMLKGKTWTKIKTIHSNEITSYSVRSLAPSTIYKFRVRAIAYSDSGVKENGDLSSVSVKTIPSTVTGFSKSKHTSNTITLKWNKNASAQKYEIWMRKGKTWKKMYTTANNSVRKYTVRGLNPATKYSFRIRAIAMDGATKLNGVVSSKTEYTRPATVKGLKCSRRAKNSITLKWKKQSSQTTGYQIQYSTNKSFKKVKTVNVNNHKTTSKTIRKIRANKKYYVRIRSYKTVKVNGKSTKLYSAWSTAKTVTTKR